MNSTEVTAIETIDHPQVPISAARPKIDAKDFDAAAQQLGLEGVDAAQAHALRVLGLYVEQEGAVIMSLGNAMVTKQRLQRWLDVLEDVEGNTQDEQLRVNCAQVAGSLLDKCIKNEEVVTKMMELRGGNSSEGADRPRNRSFAPGQPVVNVQLNVNDKKGGETG